jgi:hypothetical protein
MSFKKAFRHFYSSYNRWQNSVQVNVLSYLKIISLNSYPNNRQTSVASEISCNGWDLYLSFVLKLCILVKGILRQINDTYIKIIACTRVTLKDICKGPSMNFGINYNSLGLKRKYIYICWTKFRRRQNHRVILKLVMWLEQILEVTITYIVDIVWLKQI